MLGWPRAPAACASRRRRAIAALASFGAEREELDRDGPVVGGVPRHVHDAARAAPQLAAHLERPERRSASPIALPGGRFYAPLRDGPRRARAIVARPPMVIGIGLDLVETARVERALARYGERFVRQADGPGGGGRACPRRRRSGRGALALAVAGKEAASKALGTGWSAGRALARRGGRRSSPRRACGSRAGPPRWPARSARAAAAACGSRSAGSSRSASSGSSRDAGRLAARRNLLVTVAMVFAVFTGFAFVLPFLPLFVRELGVREPERAALWAGVLIGVAPAARGPAGAGLGPARRPPRPQGHRGEGARRLRRASSRSPPPSRASGSCCVAADRHRPLRRHRPAGARDGHRAGAARGHRPRGRPRSRPRRSCRPRSARSRAGCWPTRSASGARSW